jgi:hypothetical protein
LPVQPSELPLVQVTHAPPPPPQVPLGTGLRQLVPEQQPFGQLVASHTQPAPPAPQRWPPPHAGPQVEPVQQPLGQLVASHTHAPERQRWPAPQPPNRLPQRHEPSLQVSLRLGSQVTQTCPPLPQAANVAGSTQAPPRQQPNGHEFASHTHAPCTQ